MSLQIVNPNVCALERAMRELPQVELPTDHYFADGMYARVLARPKDTLIVGRVHKREHFYIVAKGVVAVTMGDEPAVLYEAGTVLVSKPGTKRAVLALEDSVCMTIHRTDNTDLDDIETELVEPEQDALFDSSNRLLLGASRQEGRVKP